MQLNKQVDAYIFNNSLLGANHGAILQNMLSKVDDWYGIFDLDLVYHPLPMDLGSHDSGRRWSFKRQMSVSCLRYLR